MFTGFVLDTDDKPLTRQSLCGFTLIVTASNNSELVSAHSPSINQCMVLLSFGFISFVAHQARTAPAAGARAKSFGYSDALVFLCRRWRRFAFFI